MKINRVLPKIIALNINIAAKKVLSVVRSVLFLSLFFAGSSAAIAQTIQLLDQSGKPIHNAVVAIALANGLNTSAPEALAVMDQMNKQFLPNVLIIQQGQHVSFPNSDNIRHHVYSFSATKPFEIKLYKGAVTEPILFDQPGIVVLGCNIHDNMVGYIYVAHNETTYLSDVKGKVDLPAGTDEISIWHANLSLQNNQRITVSISQIPPLPGSDAVPITLDLLNVQDETGTQQKSSSKFKKKYN